MPLDLILPTAITTVVGILVKSLFDMLKKYVEQSTEWRKSVDRKLDAQAAKTDTLMDATQTTMRTELVHLYEKYQTRGWLTKEERAAWYDMHDRYSAMGFNGLIDSYREKLNDLPDKEV